MPDVADQDTCHLCGRPLDGLICLSCDRPRGRRMPRGPSRLSFRHARVPIAAALAGIALVFAGYERWGSGSESRIRDVTAVAPTSTTRLPVLGSEGSVFGIVGSDEDEFGVRAIRGYAFVVRASGGTSDLLTDYYMVSERFLNGTDTIELRQGARTVAAKIVLISPDPHVAKLRIDGTYPVLPVATARPLSGDLVTLGLETNGATRSAEVVSYSGSGGASHLTFSIEVPNVDDGAPILDSAGRVVGIAEPTAHFPVQAVGFAIPIAQACQAVAAC